MDIVQANHQDWHGETHPGIRGMCGKMEGVNRETGRETGGVRRQTSRL